MNLYEISNVANLTLLKKAIKKNFKLAYLDIETSPYLSYHYGVKKLFIQPCQIQEHTKITSAVFMWEYNQKPIVLQWKYKKGGGDDTELLEELVTLMNKADLIIMQNGDRFDAPVIQERLADLRLPPLKNIITFDTLKASRRSFMKAHHSLEAQARQYGKLGKIKQDMEDAIAVAKGNVKAQKARIVYNVRDVTEMRDIMLRQFNYYNLPQKFLNTLKIFTNEDKPYCVKCASRRQSRFKVVPVMVKNNHGIPIKKLECQVCKYRWTPRKDLKGKKK